MLSSEHVDYSDTSNHGDGDGSVASNMDAYEENYFALAPNTSKHSHLHREEFETIIPENISPSATSTGL